MRGNWRSWVLVLGLIAGCGGAPWPWGSGGDTAAPKGAASPAGGPAAAGSPSWAWPALDKPSAVAADGAKDAAVVGRVTWLTAGSHEQFAGPLPGADRPAFSYLVLGALRGWAAADEGAVTAQAAVAYARKSLAALEPKMGRTQTPEISGADRDFALARGGKEAAPNLAAMLAGSALAMGGGHKTGGFGAGLGALGAIPTVGELGQLELPSFSGVDVAALERLQAAKRADKNAGLSSDDKAAAWQEVADSDGGGEALKSAAKKRAAEWKKVAAAEKKHREQVAKVCAQHARDEQKLSELLGLDDDVVSTAQKADYKDEMARAYAAWGKELKECASAPAVASAAGGDMVRIPAGRFRMGTDDSDGWFQSAKPVHEVSVAAFEMDKTEVTVAAYRACVRAGKCSEPNRDGSCNWGKSDRGNHPVNCVDWNQATAFCAWAAKRLPTEEEWEYAARGSDGRDYPWGNAEPAGQLCWNKRDGTCPVGSFPAGKSPFGLFDMAGNVWEWTASGYSSNYNAARASGDSAARVMRGGSWIDLVPRFVRAAYRVRSTASLRGGIQGFRCSRSQ